MLLHTTQQLLEDSDGVKFKKLGAHAQKAQRGQGRLMDGEGELGAVEKPASCSSQRLSRSLVVKVLGEQGRKLWKSESGGIIYKKLVGCIETDQGGTRACGELNQSLSE